MAEIVTFTVTPTESGRIVAGNMALITTSHCISPASITRAELENLAANAERQRDGELTAILIPGIGEVYVSDDEDDAAEIAQALNDLGIAISDVPGFDLKQNSQVILLRDTPTPNPTS
jgi:hypothetical protein